MRHPYAPRLSAYVLRTVLASATEYAHPRKRRTPDSTQSAFQDAMRGTDTGWWADLIYTAPMLDMAARYRAEIRECVRDFLAECGSNAGDYCKGKPGDLDALTYADVIAATASRHTFEAYIGNDKRKSRDADAALWGLRFAVEWLCGEHARTYAPNL